MDYDAIAKAGSMLGSGAVIVMDETRCMVKSLMRLSYFYFEKAAASARRADHATAARPTSRSASPTTAAPSWISGDVERPGN